jgi:hypothetical protein
MSKFVKVQTELREARYLKQALDDLQLAWREHVTWQHRFSKTQRANAIVVDTSFAPIGFAPNDAGAFEVLYDDMQKKTVDALVGKVRQRYAYHKVLDEAQKAGFELIEERTGADDVVRLTVRRWT